MSDDFTWSGALSNEQEKSELKVWLWVWLWVWSLHLPFCSGPSDLKAWLWLQWWGVEGIKREEGQKVKWVKSEGILTEIGIVR